MNDERKKEFWRNWGCLIIIISFLAFTSFCAALGEKRPVGAFAEILLARIMVYIFPFLYFFLAYWVKEKIEDLARSTWIGIIAGILTFVLLMLISTLAGYNIPGVNWRLEKIYQSSDDY